MGSLWNRGKAVWGIALALSLLAGSMAPAAAYGAQMEATAEISGNGQKLSDLEPITDIREYDSNELLVVYKEKGAQLEGLPEGATEEEVTELCSLIEVDTKKDLRDAIAALEAEESVGYIQPNYRYQPLFTQDEYSNRQWAYYGEYNIGLEEAWERGPGANQEVIVAIIDVGVDYTHEDLKDAMWVNPWEEEDGEDTDGNGYVDDIYGWNFFENSNVICENEYSQTEKEYVDDHGSHIAGIIAATVDNEKGVAGIASRNNVKIMSAKVMGDNGDGYGIVGYTSAIVEAIAYAEANGASICNLSLGYETFDQVLYGAMKSSDMLFSCAAGNGSKFSRGKGWDIDSKPQYPASFDLDNIISVANMNSSGAIDDTSCYGSSSVDIGAPGTDIASTGVDGDMGGYMMMTGTSMAAPMVAAAAALLSSYYGGLTAEEMREAILGGAIANSLFEGKVASQRMLSVIGALDYYGGESGMIVSAGVSRVSAKSNDRQVTVQVTGGDSPVAAVCYAEGEQEAEYFNGGENGISLGYQQGGAASFKVSATGVYTVYVRCEDGTEAVKAISVNVPAIDSLKLSASKKTLKKGKSYRLKATAQPISAYVKITYRTSNSKVATVSSKGLIVAKKKGTAKITVTANDGNHSKKATCSVTVTN